MSRVVSTALSLIVSACAVETAALPPAVPAGDATPDASMDATADARDAVVDTSVADTGADISDTLRPDTSDTSAPSDCDTQYGAAEGYLACSESATACSFNAVTPDDCDALCTSLGGTCVTSYDNPNDPGRECELLDEEPCSMSRGTQVCVCSRP